MSDYIVRAKLPWLTRFLRTQVIFLMCCCFLRQNEIKSLEMICPLKSHFWQPQGHCPPGRDSALQSGGHDHRKKTPFQCKKVPLYIAYFGVNQKHTTFATSCFASLEIKLQMHTPHTPRSSITTKSEDLKVGIGTLTCNITDVHGLRHFPLKHSLHSP